MENNVNCDFLDCCEVHYEKEILKELEKKYTDKNFKVTVYIKYFNKVGF